MKNNPFLDTPFLFSMKILMIGSFDLILDFSKETHPKLDFYGRFAHAKAWYLSLRTSQHEMHGFD